MFKTVLFIVSFFIVAPNEYIAYTYSGLAESFGPIPIILISLGWIYVFYKEFKEDEVQTRTNILTLAWAVILTMWAFAEYT